MDGHPAKHSDSGLQRPRGGPADKGKGGVVARDTLPADVARCSGVDAAKRPCAVRALCLRFTVPPGRFIQAFLTAPPVDIKCDLMIKDEG